MIPMGLLTDTVRVERRMLTPVAGYSAVGASEWEVVEPRMACRLYQRFTTRADIFRGSAAGSSTLVAWYLTFAPGAPLRAGDRVILTDGRQLVVRGVYPEISTADLEDGQ